MIFSWPRILLFVLVTLGIALVIHPSKLRLGLAMLHTGNELQASEYLELLLQNGDSSRKNLASLAMIAENNSDYPKSTHYWELLIASYPKIQANYDSLVLRYLWLGERQKALDLLLTKQTHFSLSAYESKQILALAEQLGQPEIAAQRLWQEYQKQPQNVNTDELRELCFEANLLSCREKLLEQNLARNPKDRGSFEELGALYAYEKKDSALKKLFAQQQVPAGSLAQLQLLNDAHYWQHQDYIQIHKHQWKKAPNTKVLLQWSQNLVALGEVAEAEKALENQTHKQPSLQNKRRLLQFYASHNRPQKHAQLLNRLHQQGLTSPQENQTLWETELWQHQKEANFSSWLWRNRHRIPQPQAKQTLNILASTMHLSEQHQWLLQAVTHEPRYASIYEKWIYAVGAKPIFSQGTQRIWTQLKPSSQKRLAKYYFLWAKGEGRNQESDFWAKYLPQHDSDKLAWLTEKRDLAWGQGNYPLALGHQYSYLNETGLMPKSSLEFCKDLWWSGYKKEAVQLAEKLGPLDPEMEGWFADDSALTQSPYYRQKIIHKLTQTKQFDSLIHKLKEWNDWALAKTLPAKNLSIATWWQQIAFAIEQADWGFVENELNHFPQRRSKIPTVIQEALLYKAESELAQGKTGESNFWFQMARGQGW